MRRPPRPRAGLRGALMSAALAAGVIGCGEDLHTGPKQFPATLAMRNWADTLVVGDARPVAVRVLDEQGREVLGASVRWTVATPAVLGTHLNAAASPSGPAFDAVSATDSVRVTAEHAGTTDVLVTLTDPRFIPTSLPVKATVVVAGVRIASARDTTLTALGDTSLVRGSALGRQPASATLVPLAGQGVTWTRLGAGAVSLVGQGDSVRAVAVAPGTDTLVVSHRYCLPNGPCADTVVVHVAQSARVAQGATTYRAWSLGDSVAPQVVVQDARGNAIAGASLAVAPLTAADSAIVGVNTAAGVPAFSRAALAMVPAGARASAGKVSPSAAHRAAQPAARPLVIVARGAVASGAHAGARAGAPVALAAAAPVAPLTTPPLIAQANGTARVAVRVLAADGGLIGADTVQVVVRQIAEAVRVAPTEADLTPGDSIPVQITARDARGHQIADATFQPAMAGASYRDGRIVVPATATPGLATLWASVTGPAQPHNNPGAPIADPAPDSSHVTVHTPPPVTAGDTSSAAANTLAVPVYGPDKRPLVGVWVRFLVPGGKLAADSVQTDTAGIARTRWTPPTRVGTYTATAVLLGAPGVQVGDSAGRIVIRHTVAVHAGPAAALAFVTAPAPTATLGAVLPTAPVVQVTDQYGNPVALAGTAVTVAAHPAASVTLGGTLSVVTDTAGLARFTNLVVSGAAGARALAFAASTSTGSLAGATSAPITFTGAPANGRGTLTLSSNTVASGHAVTVTVVPQDGTGNPLGANHQVAITLAVAGANGATGTASGVTDNNGTYTATITGVRAGAAMTVSATAEGTALTATQPLAVTPGTVATLTITPSTLAFSTLGATGTLTASAADAAGNAAPTAGLVWSSSAAAVASVAAPSGSATATVTAVAPGGAVLTAQLGAASATAAVSVQQHATHLVRSAGNGLSAAVNTAVGAQPSVHVLDATNAGVGGVPVTFTVTPNGASVAGNTVGGAATQTVTSASDGTATAGPWALGTAAGAYTLTAQAPGLAAVSFAATATPGAADGAHTTVALSGASVASGASVTATVTPADQYGNKLGPQHTVAVAYAGPAGASTGTVSAVTARGDSTYTATITGVLAGTAAPVTATVDNVAAPAPASNAPQLRVVPGAPNAAHSAFSVNATALRPAQTATAAIVVKDAAGNVVTGAAPSDVAFATTAGSFAAATCANGTCSAVYTAGAVGTASLSATIGGAAVSGSPATITVSSSLVATQAIAARALTAGAAAASFTPVTAAGGQTPYTFAITGGAALPSGLAISASTGAISGTPTAARAATTFTVTVTDAAGTSASQTFSLTVNAALVATQAVPSTTLTVGTGYTPFRPVTAAGGTAPITFALTGGALPAGVAFSAATGEVSGTATSSFASATYTVTATDAAGATAASTFALRVNGVPSAPAIGLVTAGNAQLTVAFTAPASDGGAAISNYEYSTDNGVTWTARNPAATTSPLVITGLTNGTAYPVRLRAVNATGSGAPSAAVSGTPSTTPGAPTIGSVAATTSQLTVTFAAPSTDGGSAITTYQYSTDGGATWTARSPASTASPLVITGLTNGTTYQVALRAVNANGAGAASAATGATTLSAPGAPTSISATGANAAAAVTWTAPSSTGGSAITDYTVQYSADGGATWATFAHPASTATTATVTGLTNGTAYLFRVAAVSAAGTGAWSATATATPSNPNAPGAPTGLAVSFNQTSGTAEDGTLTWTAPANAGTTAITDYVVEYKTASATTWTTLTRAASTSTTATITGLAVATTYDFRVSAVNSSGSGAPSAPLVAATTGPSTRLSCTTPGSSNSSANSISIAPCAGVQLGNVIVVPLSIGNTSGAYNAITAESGFQVLGTQLSGTTQTTILYKVATSADVGRTTPYTFGWSGNVKSVVTLVTYKNIYVPTSADFLSATGTGTVATSPAATVSASAYTLAYFFAPAVPLSSTSPSLGEWTVSSGIWKNTTAGSNNNNAIAVLTSDVDKSAAGTTAGQTAQTSGMTSGTVWNSVVLVLRPTP